MLNTIKEAHEVVVLIVQDTYQTVFFSGSAKKSIFLAALMS